MAILAATPRPALPSVAHAVFRLVDSSPDRALAQDEAVELLAPESAVESQDPVRAAIRVLLELGMLEDEAGTLRVASRFVAEQPVTVAVFRDLLRDAVLAPEANDGLFATEDGARELTRALAWFLAQAVDDPPATHDARDSRPHAAALLDEQIAETRPGEMPILRNKDRWPPFVRWSRFLGFASVLPSAASGLPPIQPDPTDAVRSTLATIARVSADREIELREVVAKLADVNPVLDGGRYRREVEDRMAAPPFGRSGGGTVSPALSLALLRLSESGELALSLKHDFPHVLTLEVVRGEPKRYSHAQIVPGSPEAS